MGRRPHGVRTITAVAMAGVIALTGGTASAAPPVAAPTGHLSCHGPVLGCVRDARHILEDVRDRLGCDHRAPFPAIYVQLQRSLETAVADGGTFDEPSWLAGSLNTAFVNLYLDAHEADRAGRPVPAAWDAAFEAARTADVNAGQDVLLGANAHIQRDMPYVLAALGLTRPGGGTRKTDYDRFQAVLDRAYGPAVQDVARRYDPLVALADDRWNPIAGLTAGQLLRTWRAQAWEHALQLAAAPDQAARDRVARRIETNAAQWAQLLGTVSVPGYRTVRDEYCRTRPGRELAPAVPAPAGAPASTPAGVPASVAAGVATAVPLPEPAGAAG
ncbi:MULTISPECIES: DUF5995 family protein [Streptomyces]|uniref:Uncharacterized protein n=2 Tax=Streptomyces TaxID=1883 RepID=A0A100Y4Z0_9ACTN|nr:MULTISPECIES: DUF5995 family protein [Streptomyces]KUH37751.1 hypothetical protein ATE80_16535 [Streptomyces kanasensis]UUS34372.1 DUF5995 family protein [Streptomyces changanensis]